jgi:hypothetical protein
MNYTKPQVSTIGEAKMVIAHSLALKPLKGPIEPFNLLLYMIPAYDLDE